MGDERYLDVSGLKIMVIDDSKTIRRTAEILLKKAGCDVLTATDGFEALAIIADNQPDVIFVDIMMPRLDGYQTCALIKNNEEFKRTPVIMLSSKDGLFDRAKGRIVGSSSTLQSPLQKTNCWERSGDTPRRPEKPMPYCINPGCRDGRFEHGAGNTSE